MELSEKEMEQAAGGLLPDYGAYDTSGNCPNSPDGKHHLVKTGHIEEPHKFLFWDYTLGYDVYTCTCCEYVKQEHV